MMILTRQRRIRKALRTVLAKIPIHERRDITSFLFWIRARSGWRSPGLMCELDKSGGFLLPLFEAGHDRKDAKGQIWFTLPVCRLYTDKALVGLVAHELAHAFRATRLGRGWYEKMDRNYRVEECIADAIVVRWGFRSQIRLQRHEQKKVVIPLLHYREPQIMRMLERRAQQESEQANKRFSRLIAQEARRAEKGV